LMLLTYPNILFFEVVSKSVCKVASCVTRIGRRRVSHQPEPANDRTADDEPFWAIYVCMYDRPQQS
jgi:hypothetical protein